MSQNATIRLLTLVLVVTRVFAQGPRPADLEWRQVGNTSVEAGLAGLAGGPVERVWYSPSGGELYVRTATGAVFATRDFENWEASRAAAPVTVRAAVGTAGSGLWFVAAGARTAVRYAFGQSIFRSTDDGISWKDVTRFRDRSIIGEGLRDVAVSPGNPDEIAAATAAGVWRSVDGGLSWDGLNAGLPNLAVRRMIAVHPPTVDLGDAKAVWRPGAKAWETLPAGAVEDRAAALEKWSRLAGVPLTASAETAAAVYAGDAIGGLYASFDQGRSWRHYDAPSAAAAIEAVPGVPGTAFAVLSGTGGARVVRTVNGGLFWEDITGNLPRGEVAGLAVDRDSATLYVASAAGTFEAEAALYAAAGAASWTRLGGEIAELPATDVRLDSGGNQLFVALDGYGVFAALAPHRMRNPRIVSAADRMARPAAPGTLLSILGSLARDARAGSLDVPVFGFGGGETQLQVPFAVSGNTLSLQWTETGGRARSISMPLEVVSPAIFLDRDGAPMLLDADRGVLLDVATPARAGGRIQILATGLGRVTPDWPTGLAAPAANPPRVAAPVRVFLDRSRVEITQATLAPGYVGFYLVEFQVPDFVNEGPAELYIEAGEGAGRQSSRVTLHLVQ